MRATLVTVMILGAVSTANAGTIFTFSFSNVLGNVPGSVTGTITLDFVTLVSDSGTGSASSIVITSAPAAVLPLDEGNVVTNWTVQAMNTFTVASGVISGYQFGASAGIASPTDSVFCLNSGALFGPFGSYVCTANETGPGDGTNFVFNQGVLPAVTFERVTSVPEPTQSFLLAGIGVIAVVVFGIRSR